jgi:cytochrome c oxidase subunit II
MRLVPLFLFAIACGGSEPATPTPAPGAAPTAPEPAPEPAVEKDEGKAFESMSADEKTAHLMELGEEVYNTGGSSGMGCVTCHQATGAGLPGAFPPLKGSDALGDCKTHAGYVIKGVSGEMEVNGTKYNGVMPPQGALSDMEVAAVITYERMSWGNDFGGCTPEDAKGAR